MNYQIISTEDEWGKIISHDNLSKQSDIYFAYHYYLLYSLHAEPEAFVIKIDDNIFFLPYLKSRIEKNGVVHGYDIETAYGYGGLLCEKYDEDFLNQAWRSFFEYAEANNFICGLLRFHPLLKNQNYATFSQIELIKEKKTVYLSCSKSLSEARAEYSKDNKSRLRKAAKQNVTVSSYQDLNSLELFYELYTERMDSLNAKEFYFFSRDYFKYISHFPAGSFKVYFAYYNKSVIGGALVFFSDRYCHYHLSAARQEFLSLSPNNVLRDAVIEDVFENYTMDAIHFGGGRTTLDTDSLLQFKQKFSNELSDFYIGKCIFNVSEYQKLCLDWTINNPEKARQSSNLLMKYRS